MTMAMHRKGIKDGACIIHERVSKQRVEQNLQVGNLCLVASSDGLLKVMQARLGPSRSEIASQGESVNFRMSWPWDIAQDFLELRDVPVLATSL